MHALRSGCDLTRRAVLGMTAAAGIPHFNQLRVSTRILIVGGRGSQDIAGDVREAVDGPLRADAKSVHLVRVGDQILLQVVTDDATVFYPLANRDFRPESCGSGHRPASRIEQNVHCFLKCGDLEAICSRVGLLADRKPAATR